MAALICVACHLFPCDTSFSTSFSGNEPKGISNNAKINMVIRMSLLFPFILLFILLWVCFLTLFLYFHSFFLLTGWHFATKSRANMQRVHMNIKLKFMCRYINILLAVELMASLGTPSAIAIIRIWAVCITSRSLPKSLGIWRLMKIPSLFSTVQTLWLLVTKRTIPTKRPPLVDEI
jgi:hypothetical protein